MAHSFLPVNRFIKGGLIMAWVLAGASISGQSANGVTYTLLSGSYFLDQCFICGRPDILQPMLGTFELTLSQNTPPYTRYQIQNVDFSASPQSFLERRLTGDGVYSRFEEFAVLQSMFLNLQVKDSYTNRPAFFTNNSALVDQPFPLIGVDLTESNGTPVQTFSLHLLAAPVSEIWFSTRVGFVSTNRMAPTNQISAGDLLSNKGRIVKRNIDLTGRLGIMPIVPDLGLDAVQVTKGGEILFSIPVSVFSETLGPLQHGDVLSNLGAIVKRNQQLLAAFHPLSTNDAGLDAFQVLPSGEILFSTTTDVPITPTTSLRHGDLLSDKGQVYLTQEQLLSKFHPADTNQDFGLDAFYVLPWGEVWFSVQTGFDDDQIGQVREGDLLSNLGYRVMNYQSLLFAFQPSDPSQDYGLDSLFVITDLQAPSPPPRLLQCKQAGNLLHLTWTGEGAVFQVETTATLNGPWATAGPILPDLKADVPFDSANGAGFFRLRQW